MIGGYGGPAQSWSRIQAMLLATTVFMSAEPRFPMSQVTDVEILLPPELGDEYLAEFTATGFTLTDPDGNRHDMVKLVLKL